MNVVDETQEKIDRKLGDEWKDWDGSSAIEANAGKRLFFSLTGGYLLFLGAVGLLGWYLVAPRLAQWHRYTPTLLLVLIAVFILLQLTLLGVIALALLFHSPLPRVILSMTQRMITCIEGSVFSLGTLLSINRDRIAHSFVLINNALIRSHDYPTDPSKILILLPRCLTKEQIQAANALSKEYGVNIAVVAGGELARQRIKERQAEAIIGVACERDLLSGIRDIRGKLRVLGIPNIRPCGPCKDTLIDLQQLRESIEFYIRPKASESQSLK